MDTECRCSIKLGGCEFGKTALINFGGAWAYAGFSTSRAQVLRLGPGYESGPWSAKAALFDTKVDDLNAVLPGANGRGETSILRSHEFDGSLTYTGTDGFATLNFTYADVEVNGAAASSTDYYIGRPMGRIIVLEMGYDLNPEWRIGATAQFTLENDDTVTVFPSDEVLDVYAEYKPNRMKNLDVRLDVQNLFGAHSYVVVLTGSTTPGSFN